MEPQKKNQDVTEYDLSIKFGQFLANPPSGEEVIISGVAGRYPECENVDQFRENLFNKVDMVSDDDRRWKPGHPEIPQRSGKIPHLDAFDAGFFGFDSCQANQMDPLVRIFMEVAVEAIFDAGLHPSDLEGTNTGIFVGSCSSETEHTWFRENLIPHGYAILGNERSFVVNHVSNFLKLKGPSMICDSACSSSFYALENAYKAIRMGLCDSAIVGGSSVCLHPFFSLQFARLGLLSPDGACKAFDKNGNGYVRSEAICAILLQKSKDAKRLYSTIVHAKTNSDGFKNSGITYPSGDMQISLMKRFYKECSIIPNKISFLEAHGTGTQVGDPEELEAIDKVFTENRSTPLLIGSVKSNIGHTEPCSGLCSVTKAIIAAETGYIPPNIYYTECRPGLKGLERGRLKVVTEKTLLDNNGLIGVNSFGFGGSNAHVLLKQNLKEKTNSIIAQDDLPRLVCVSGRTEYAVNCLLDDVVKNRVDVEQVRLIHNIFRKNVPGHLYRGYTLASKSTEISRSLSRCTKILNLIVCFGDTGKGTNKLAKEFLELPFARSTIQGIDAILSPKGLNLLNILYSSKYFTVFELIIANFAFQVLLADLIKACDIVPIKTYGITKGFSLGALVCAYFNGDLTLQQATECAYTIASATQSAIDGNIDNKNKNTAGSIKEHNALGFLVSKLSTDLVQSLGEPKILRQKLKPRHISFDVSTFLEDSSTEENVITNIKSLFRNEWAFLEIGNGEIKRILENSLSNHNKKTFIQWDGGINSVLISIGRLYEIGFNPQIENLYPKIQFPVSRGTPMISPNIKWNHDRKWNVAKHESKSNGREEVGTTIMINDTDYSYMSGHVIDGRNLLPAAGYLYLAWSALANISGYLLKDTTVVFENCKFKKATSLPKAGIRMEIRVQIQKVSGNFEVNQGGLPVVSGNIFLLANNTQVLDEFQLPPINRENSLCINKKDTYKELRLRGYIYSGQFQAIQSCDTRGQLASIEWDDNWVTFLENMLQAKILGEDTRQLYIPMGIRRLVIDARRHLEYVKSFGGEKPIIPVMMSKKTGIIRSKHIEIKGLLTNIKARRGFQETPVIEKYVFVANTCSLSNKEAIRVNMQILLENLTSVKVKVVELIDEATFGQQLSLAETIFDVFADQPLAQPEITVLSKKNLDIKNAKVEDKKLLMEFDCSLVVGSKILQRNNVLYFAFSSLKENGFLLSREPLDFNIDTILGKDINIVTILNTGEEILVLFKKRSAVVASTLIEISSKDTDFNWVTKLQKELCKSKHIILYSQGEPTNGLLGMVTCIRREIGGQNIRLVFITSSAPDFNINIGFYKNQLDKNLAINIYNDGEWGTYRYLRLEKSESVEADHCYLTTLRRGDLSSLEWTEGPSKLENKLTHEKNLVYTHYAALNCRDIMVASGRINADSITKDRREQKCLQGVEFSGVTESGEKVMGMVNNGACASVIAADSHFLWKVPENWSLQQAATVPVFYSICIMGLMTKGKMKKGESILIHSGADGVGLAAIQIALYVGSIVYTTVGTPEKREFLKMRFPALEDQHISNSRTEEFEKFIMKATNGKGVDIVLNSLSKEKLLASVRCLKQEGRFIQIGKYDLAKDTTLNLSLLEKSASFHGVMVESLMDANVESKKSRLKLYEVFKEFLENGAIQPLPDTVFKMNEVESAFRYMTTGKYIGKVLIEIRQEQIWELNKLKMKFSCIPRYHCDENKTYIICGGLGGFGLELADWLVLRGCTKLILSSRNGIKTGYQAYRISIWKSYGTKVEIFTDDITTYEGCLNLIKTSNKIGPVHAIFNLATVLKDAIFENQSAESFKIGFGPKVNATQHLDVITRELCPNLRDFVVFSSVTSGRGNVGQTNYGMANSAMEKICEKRKSENLPGLAIQWGAIGDVGLLADMQDKASEVEIVGTIQQRISNCIEIMDQLLNKNNSAIVSSIVVAEKKSLEDLNTIVDSVVRILGIKNIKSVSLKATLTEIGMDSITAAEIRQTLDHEYEVFLSPQDIKQLTFAKLLEIQTEKNTNKSTDIAAPKNEKNPVGLATILKKLPDEQSYGSLFAPIQLKTGTAHFNSTVVFLPGVESSLQSMEGVYQNGKAKLVDMLYPYKEQEDTIEGSALQVLSVIEDKIPKDQQFNLVCQSIGCLVSLQVAHFLEQKGYFGTVICIDSAPNYLRDLLRFLDVKSDGNVHVSSIIYFAEEQSPGQDDDQKHSDALYKYTSFEEKIKLVQSIIAKVKVAHSPEHQRMCTINRYKRLKAMSKRKPPIKLKSKVLLFKPTMVGLEEPDISGLLSPCECSVDERSVNRNHYQVLENLEIVKDDVLDLK